MSVKAVILGILQREPLHGYDLKRIIEREMGDWANIAFGSIYFALEGLAKDGFVTSEAREGAGHRPSRIVYTITEAGRTEFLRLLRELWQDRAREQSPLDIAMAFCRDLPRDEVRGYLEARRAYLAASLEYLKAHEEETMRNPYVPKESRFIFSHARHRLQAELGWTAEVLEGL